LKPDVAPLSLSLVVRPEWSNAESLRTAVVALVRAAIGDGEAATNAGMVARELAENAIKYGDWSRASGFGFLFKLAGAEASVEVVSPYDDSSGSVDRLERVLRSVREHSAKEAYLRRLAEVAENAGEVGRLGLLRVAHELDATINATLENGDLRVRAKWSLGAER
jgi:hypothetical protein